MAAAKIVFTAEEKELLVSLLKREKVIEDKRTNKATNKLKAEAWDRIKARYNSHAFVSKREIMQLRRCWEKIKRMEKDARSKEIKCRMATGGGSPPRPSGDYVPGVDEVVPHLMYEIPNTVDSDTVFTHDRETETYETKVGWETSQISNPTIFLTEETESPLPEPVMPLTPSVSYNQPSNSTINFPRGESPPPSTTQTCDEEKETPPNRQLNHPLINRNNTSVRKRLASATDLINTRKKNILEEREENKELFLVRSSILMLEKEIAAENLRSVKVINNLKETAEFEKLEHQRKLQKKELQHTG